MTTIKNALVKRLSLCRKRIMDGLGPSTLYAQAGISLNAQLSCNCRVTRFIAIIDERRSGKAGASTQSGHPGLRDAR